MRAFCSILFALCVTPFNTVQGLPSKENINYEDLYSSARAKSTRLKEKYSCTFPKMGDDEILNERQKSDRTFPLCISVTGFSSRDFTGNGLYCQHSHLLVEKRSDKQQSPEHYTYISSPNTLRYEIRPDKDGLWTLLRVIKTKGNKWIGKPIYAGLPLNRTEIPTSTSPANGNTTMDHPTYRSPTNLEWIGLKQKHQSKGEIEFDRTEPNLQASEVYLPSEYMLLHWTLQSHLLGKISPCTALMCSHILQDEIIKNEDDNKQEHNIKNNSIHESDNDDYFAIKMHTKRMVAQLAEIIGQNNEAAKWYERANGSIKAQITKFASKHKPIPRILRWELASINMDLARSYAKTKHINRAIESILVGLANSPEQKQRRQLFQDLGDLRLVLLEFDAAKASYEQAKNAVKSRGGNVDDVSFWANFDDENDFNSIGSVFTSKLRPEHYKAKQLRYSKISEQEGKQEGNDRKRSAMAMPPSFSIVRAKILLGLDKGNDWEEITIKLHDTSWLDVWETSSSLEECFLDVISI